MSPRARIPTDVETELLTRSGRRCCLCFGLNGDFVEKAGQIAHVNQDSSDSRLENLAWLCLEHHDRYDSKTSQSKGITMRELVSYRDQLYAKVERFRVGDQRAPAPPAESTRERLRRLLAAINPEVLRRVDAGEAAVPVMISRPREAVLFQLVGDGDGASLLRAVPTGASIIASRGARIGGYVHDLFDGADMSGYRLVPGPDLPES